MHISNIIIKLANSLEVHDIETGCTETTGHAAFLPILYALYATQRLYVYASFLFASFHQKHQCRHRNFPYSHHFHHHRAHLHWLLHLNHTTIKTRSKLRKRTLRTAIKIFVRILTLGLNISSNSGISTLSSMARTRT